MNIVLGARGRLGGALAAALPPDQVIAPERAVYADWWREDGADAARRYLGAHAGAGDTVLVAAGLIDPALPAALHDQVNLRLPMQVIDAATRLGMRVLTFGTVMEKIVPADTENPYYSSKIRLGRFVEQYLYRSGSALHVRIHTLFGGGPPDRFMFLGQIANALRTRSVFRMTSGDQLREYHHVDDEVEAIRLLAASDLSGSIELSHGRPLALKDLADHVFAAFGCRDLLQIGVLPAPAADNFQRAFTPPAELQAAHFREPLAAIVAYLQQAGCAVNRDDNNMTTIA